MSDFLDLDITDGTQFHLEPQAHGGALLRYDDFEDDETLPEVIRPVPVDLWPPRLPMEIALCQSVEAQVEAVEKFSLTPEEFDRIARMPEFRRAVSEAGVALRESGYGFKQKCRAIAEDFLAPLDLHLHDPAVGLSTKVDIFKTLTKLGELEPKAKKEDALANAPTVNIQINL